jgi:NDP-sugar pyrophosphorylase family protein
LFTIISTLVNNKTIGILSLATLQDEAPTHNVAKIDDTQRVYDIEFPPPDVLDPDHLRDMTLYAFTPEIFEIMKSLPPEQLYISPGIGEFLENKKCNSGEFLGEVYNRQWWHFACPEDLTFKRDYRLN